MKHTLILTAVLFLLLSGLNSQTLPPGYPARSADLDVVPGFQNPPTGYGQVPIYWWMADTLTGNKELMIEYTATTDQVTIVNPTHHSYFNLSGDPGKAILDHELMIDADFYTPINKEGIPPGEIKSVDQTPMEFRRPVKIGSRIGDDFDQLMLVGDYDHNWILNNYTGCVRMVATLYDKSSGRYVELLTDQPGLQFYSGSALSGVPPGKNGLEYRQYSGLCRETQHFPNSPNTFLILLM
jgi:aldose 1-epimerase